MTAYRVLIADDSERARQAMRLLLAATTEFAVAAEAADGEEAVRKTCEIQPDLVLMDIGMPRMGGLEATRRIKQVCPQVKIVIVSVSDDATDLFDAIRSGAQGYLVKRLQPTDWIAYLRGVMDGTMPLSPGIAAKLLSEFRAEDRRESAPAGIQSAGAAATGDRWLGARPEDKLTAREKEILDLVRTGATNREIAACLFISENTVKNHLKNIMAKLDVQNRVQLALYAADRPHGPWNPGP